MTDDGGRDGSTGDGPARPDGEDLSPGLRELDDELRSVRFRPRAGLEDDVMDRVADAPGDPRRSSPADPLRSPAADGWRRAARAAVAVLALVGLLGLLDRTGPARAPGGTAAAGPGPDAAEVSDGWTMQWSPDARVLALGTASTSTGLRGTGGRELRCGRVDSRIRCRGGEPGAIPSPPDAAEGGAVLRDFCCLDYDGGGPADDGVRVVAGRDEAVVDFWIYEDRDRSRSFTAGDPLRTVVPGVAPATGGSGVPRGVRRLDRCCADLDGGPRRDDGVFVLAGGRERVALAVLYEDENGDGRLSPGDRLRAVRTDDGSRLGDGGTERDR